MFTDLSKPGGRGPGMDAYPDRAAWLAGRRDWKARHGMTVAEWSAASLAELQHRAASLADMSQAIGLTMFEPDDWSDPRTWSDPRAWTTEQQTPQQQRAAAAAMLAKMERA